jgi:L-ribulokinase
LFYKWSRDHYVWNSDFAMKPLAIGLDFGTESARALLLDLEHGRELAVAVEPYPHGVLTRRLPSGAPLPALWALHHPADYLQVSQVLLQKMRLEAHQSGGTVVGIGLESTNHLTQIRHCSYV